MIFFQLCEQTDLPPECNVNGVNTLATCAIHCGGISKSSDHIRSTRDACELRQSLTPDETFMFGATFANSDTVAHGRDSHTLQSVTKFSVADLINETVT